MFLFAFYESFSLICNFFRDDDVRSSLDLLDEVIGEFDDGLTSAAESDILLGASVTTPVTKRHHRPRSDRHEDVGHDRISSRINGSNINRFSKNGDHRDKDSQLIEEPIKANVRNIRPPASSQKKQREQSAPPYLNGARSRHLPNSDHRSQVLNHQIDDIFSELTNEIYVEDKRDRKSATRADNIVKHNRVNAKVDSGLSLNGSEPSRNGKNSHLQVSSKKRQQGPVDAPPLPPSSIVSPSTYTGSSAGSQSTRHVNDPLPAPPTSKGVVSSMAAKLSSGAKR